MSMSSLDYFFAKGHLEQFIAKVGKLGTIYAMQFRLLHRGNESFERIYMK